MKKTKFVSHLVCGLLAGIAGFVYFMHVCSGSASHASGMEMNAIASSSIGGTMLTGGVGNIIGTFFGVLSLATIQNIVASAGLDQAWWTGITIAAMFDRPWNKQAEFPNDMYVRCKDWNEIDRIFEAYKRTQL